MKKSKVTTKIENAIQDYLQNWVGIPLELVETPPVTVGSVSGPPWRWHGDAKFKLNTGLGFEIKIEHLEIDKAGRILNHERITIR